MARLRDWVRVDQLGNPGLPPAASGQAEAVLPRDVQRLLHVLHPLDGLEAEFAIRFSLNGSANGNKAITTLDMIEPLSKRVNALGWHVQINMSGEQIVAAEDL